MTKNGECLRRHAESTQRWRTLRDRIARTDKDMESIRKTFATGEPTPSEAGSSASGLTPSRSGNLLAPPSGSKSRGLSASSTISRSISPFRKLARRLKQGAKSPGNATPALPKLESRTPSAEPLPTLRHRSSLFNLMNGSGRATPVTPGRPSHKHTQSLTPDSSPTSRKVDTPSTSTLTLKSRRPVWNSSTRVQDETPAPTLKASNPRRTSNVADYQFSEDNSPLSSVAGTPYKRSVSRSSMASSRPWSPVTSSVSTAHSSYNQPLSSFYRPPSRAQTPGVPLSPRSRPKTPSHIPAPSKHWRSMSSSRSESDFDDEGLSSLMQRAFSPNRSQTPSGIPPRPPSRSMIPLPSVQISSSSRPSSAMSNYRPDSAMSFRGSALRTQTPDALRKTPRPSILQSRAPPSSFKESTMPRTPISRPPSRGGHGTPGHDSRGPTHIYVPASQKDPLDAEVASVANGMTHGLLIERIDPPLRTVPREGEEIRAQYAFSNVIARKVVTCKLTTLARSGAKGRDHATKKVMCRVGGGRTAAIYL